MYAHIGMFISWTIGFVDRFVCTHANGRRLRIGESDHLGSTTCLEIPKGVKGRYFHTDSSTHLYVYGGAVMPEAGECVSLVCCLHSICNAHLPNGQSRLSALC